MQEVCGALVAADFGSVAGEVAVCRQAVAIADRSELTKLELRGSSVVLERLVDVIDRPRLCPLSGQRLLALFDPCQDSAAVEALRAEADRATGGLCIDVSRDYAALLLLGPRTEELLASPELGSERDPPAVGRADDLLVASCPAHLLREGESQFLLLTDNAHAVPVWRALHDAGEPLGLGNAGREALGRFETSGRTVARQHQHQDR